MLFERKNTYSLPRINRRQLYKQIILLVTRGQKINCTYSYSLWYYILRVTVYHSTTEA